MDKKDGKFTVPWLYSVKLFFLASRSSTLDNCQVLIRLNLRCYLWLLLSLLPFTLFFWKINIKELWILILETLSVPNIAIQSTIFSLWKKQKSQLKLMKSLYKMQPNFGILGEQINCYSTEGVCEKLPLKSSTQNWGYARLCCRASATCILCHFCYKKILKKIKRGSGHFEFLCILVNYEN